MLFNGLKFEFPSFPLALYLFHILSQNEKYMEAEEE